MNGYIGNDNRERNERRTDMGAPIHIWVFSYLPSDRRDRVLFRTARRNYFTAAWEFATAREPKHYNLPFQQFLRLSKPRSWTCDPEHVKYRCISLGPLDLAGIGGEIDLQFVKIGKLIKTNSILPYETSVITFPITKNKNQSLDQNV